MTLRAVKRFANGRSALVGVGLLLFFIACQKEAEFYETERITLETFTTEILPNLSGEVKNFFTTDYASGRDARLQELAGHRSTDPLIDAAKLNLYLQDAELSNTLISSLLGNVGYPIWDHAIIDYSEENTISIPFTKLDGHSMTTAVLMGYGNSDLSQFHFLLITKSNIDEQMQLHSLEDNVWNLAGSVYSIYKHEVEVFEYVDSNYAAWMNGQEWSGEGVESAGERTHTISVCVECPPNIASVTQRPVYTTAGKREICCAVVQLACNPDQGITTYGSCAYCGGNNAGPPGASGSSTAGGSSSSSNDGPNPLEDGGANNNDNSSGNNEQEEEEECRASSAEFIEDNRFSLSNIKALGLNIEECCEAENEETCMWGILSTAYNLPLPLEDYQNEIVPYLTENDWTIAAIIDGEIYAKDKEGVLKLDIDPINMVTSTDLEVFEQIVKVIENIHVYFCAGNSYEPIDWQDYFTSVNDRSGLVNWEGCENTYFEITFTFGANIYLMDTEPTNHSDTDTGYKAEWPAENASGKVLLISVPHDCVNQLWDFMYSNCD